jgi:hypothetical protein
MISYQLSEKEAELLRATQQNHVLPAKKDKITIIATQSLSDVLELKDDE